MLDWRWNFGATARIDGAPFLFFLFLLQTCHTFSERFQKTCIFSEDLEITQKFFSRTLETFGRFLFVGDKFADLRYGLLMKSFRGKVLIGAWKLYGVWR